MAETNSPIQADAPELTETLEQAVVEEPAPKPLNSDDPVLMEGVEHLRPYLYDAIKDRVDSIPRKVLEDLIAGRDVPRKAMVAFHIPFDRHQMRELAVEAIYQHLLLEKDIRKCLYSVLCHSNDVDGFLYNLSVGTVEDEDELKEKISSKLRSDWTWERLSRLEQAILLMAAHEMELGQTPKSVVINEAVTLAKEYCDESAPAMINGILDHLDA